MNNTNKIYLKLVGHAILLPPPQKKIQIWILVARPCWGSLLGFWLSPSLSLSPLTGFRYRIICLSDSIDLPQVQQGRPLFLWESIDFYLLVSLVLNCHSLYSLRFILLDGNIDVSRHILVVGTSILASSNMDRKENQLLVFWHLYHGRIPYVIHFMY